MKFKDLLFLESINDKHLFKAVFLAGGPGSGKSFITEKMFRGLPIVFFNSDFAFEHLLKKNQLPLVIDKADIKTYAKQMAVRKDAVHTTYTRRDNWIEGMLPLVIDGTGKDYQKIWVEAESLRKMGYDVSMIFVNTTLEVSQKRNAARERKLPESDVEKFWHSVQNNMGKFQEFFGASNFHIIDNNDDLTEEEIKDLGLKLFRMGKKIIESPLQNPVGKFTIEHMKAYGFKYLSEFLSYLNLIDRKRA